MAIAKTEVISVREPPAITAALASAAEVERRSLASMCDVMALGYCRAHGHAPHPATSVGGRKIRRR